MSKNKKKENKKKKEEDPYIKYAVPRDLTIESFKNPKEPYVVATYRIKAQVIDETSTVRGPKPPPPYDPFLAYLEFKMSKPWYERMFLP